MATRKTDIYVYADWIGLNGPVLMGVLSAQQAKGRKAFHFSYDRSWVNTDGQRHHGLQPKSSSMRPH